MAGAGATTSCTLGRVPPFSNAFSVLPADSKTSYPDCPSWVSKDGSGALSSVTDVGLEAGLAGPSDSIK